MQHVHASLQRGFTMIEAGVVVTIMGIAAALAAPSLATFLDTMDAKGAAMDLVGDLMTARSEALKRNTSVTVAPIGSNWTQGWTVTTADTTPVVVREHAALRSGLAVSSLASVVFLSNGRLANTDDAPDNVTWSITSSKTGVLPRCVVITTTGSARAKSGSC